MSFLDRLPASLPPRDGATLSRWPHHPLHLLSRAFRQRWGSCPACLHIVVGSTVYCLPLGCLRLSVCLCVHAVYYHYSRLVGSPCAALYFLLSIYLPCRYPYRCLYRLTYSSPPLPPDYFFPPALPNPVRPRCLGLTSYNSTRLDVLSYIPLALLVSASRHLFLPLRLCLCNSFSRT